MTWYKTRNHISSGLNEKDLRVTWQDKHLFLGSSKDANRLTVLGILKRFHLVLEKLPDENGNFPFPTLLESFFTSQEMT